MINDEIKNINLKRDKKMTRINSDKPDKPSIQVMRNDPWDEWNNTIGSKLKKKNLILNQRNVEGRNWKKSIKKKTTKKQVK